MPQETDAALAIAGMLPDDAKRFLKDNGVEFQASDRNGTTVFNIEPQFFAGKMLEMIESNEVSILRAAIRKHRDQRGDDRCWLDDEELYKVLPEGYEPPAREVSVELGLCQKFISCRRNPKTEYVSPQREIERLQAEVVKLNADLAGMEKA